MESIPVSIAGRAETKDSARTRGVLHTNQMTFSREREKLKNEKSHIFVEILNECCKLDNSLHK